jgi:hypothetical protein
MILPVQLDIAKGLVEEFAHGVALAGARIPRACVKHKVMGLLLL